MAYWKIEFEPEARKERGKLDKYSSLLIQNYLNNRISKLDDPKHFGKPLIGNLRGFWKYRIDKFRIICEIQEKRLIVLVVQIVTRDNAY